MSVLNVVSMHVGHRYNTRAAAHAYYTDNDLKRLMKIGVNEVCISYGSDVTSYTWYSFPNILIQRLALRYIEPWTQYYNYMKSSTPSEVWE